MRKIVPLLILPFILAGCGGGGGGSSSPDTSIDSDGDGVVDSKDAFPFDPTETLDSDKDGVGDNADAFPLDATETLDSDNDGVGDNRDQFPFDATETTDIDRDGIGDNSDPDLQRYAKPTSYDAVATSISDLKSKLSSASAGDVIALADGTYSNVDLDISKDGVIVVAQTSGKVFIEGESSVDLSGDNIIFEGFTFRNGEPSDSKGAIIISGSYNRVTNCKIDHFDNGGNNYKWISLDNDAKYGEVDHCTFTGKETEGALLVVWRDDTSEQFHHIYRNIFSDHQYVKDKDIGTDGPDNNGWESIRIGTSTESHSDSSTIVEANYFHDANGEIEIISNKSGNNLYRYNTFESSSGLLTLRHGENCTVDSNYFLIDNNYGGGIRVIDGGHTISNNYIEGANSTSNSRGAIVLSSSENNPALSGYWDVEDITINNNTVINSKQSLHYGSSAKDNAPKSADIINNLIYTSETFVSITNGLNVEDAYYENNYFWGGGSLGFSPTPTGINFSAIELTTSSNGQYYAKDPSANLGAPKLVKLSFDDPSMGVDFDH